MTNNYKYCTPEQSKRLWELGLKMGSEKLWVEQPVNGEYELRKNVPATWAAHPPGERSFPAWDLSELCAMNDCG